MLRRSVEQRAPKRRIPVAEIIAVLAICTSLTAGGAVASHLVVRTSDLARNAVNGSKVDNGTLTGADVKEPSLGKVPSALKVSGSSATRFSRVTTTTAEEPLAQLGTLRLTYQCVPGLAFVPLITALTTVDDASITGSVVWAPNPGDEVYTTAYADFDTNETIALDEGRGSASIRFTYRAPSGSIVSGSLDTAATGSACHAQGVLLGG